MENPRFNVGDEVVALESRTKERQAPIIKNEIYTVKSVQYCSTCGVQDVYVGLKVPNHFSSNVSCECGNRYPHRGLYWSYARRFALLQNMTAQIEQALEEPITCT